MEGFQIPLDILKEGASKLNINLTHEQLGQYAEYARMLVEANKHINLTRIIEHEDIVYLHYLDSLTCLAVYNPEPGSEAIDIGTGAGFPGLAIKIAMPELNMTLVDSTGKKIRFVESVIDRLGLRNVRAISARAEELCRRADFREHFAVVYARALSELAVTCEVCLPLVKVSGRLIAPKAGDIEDELKGCQRLLGELGGADPDVREVQIPGTDIVRKIVLISKISHASNRYPRPYADIAKDKQRRRGSGAANS